MLDPQGRIWVADPRAGRMPVFDPVEGFLESFRFTYLMRGFIWGGTMTDRGHILKPSMSGEEEEYDPEDSPGAFYFETPGGGYGLHGIPYYPGGTSHIDRNGERWTAEVADPGYRMERSVPGGDTTLIVITARPPVPVTAAERDSVINRVRESLQASGVTTEMDWSRIPDVKPSVETIFTSAEGTLWVGIPTQSGGTDYDVLSNDGSYLGTVATGTLDVLGWFPPIVDGGHIPGRGNRRAGRALRRAREDRAGAVIRRAPPPRCKPRYTFCQLRLSLAFIGEGHREYRERECRYPQLA